MDLIGFSMMRNEEDIVEQFVRHNIRFFKKLYVFDHGSVDCTGEILRSLNQEGLPVIPLYSAHLDSLIGHAQMEVMTTMIKFAVADNGAAIYFPIDADEFLHPRKDMDAFRQMVEESEDWVFSVPHLNMPIVPDCAESLLADVPKSLNRLQRWRSVDHQYSKVAIKITDPSLVDRLLVCQGNHNVILDGNVVEKKANEDLLGYIHVPVRSSEQAYRKFVCGWLSNVQRFGIDTRIASHWKHIFNLICDDKFAPADRNLAHLLSKIYTDPLDFELDFEITDSGNLFSYDLAYRNLRKSGFGVLLRNIEADFQKQFIKASAQER
ncbi:glycosyltransferase family 2 protein [Paraburkholderia sp. J7]|uniref:glycosyltransferase family 2 protein n=1 Tax=Paraburkholderia sp. J7 TaxID=2805438 RepID=UPI002AB6A11C|nr:glycosyltransferase family 2 protein [Paraburkholderia sp. J7]